jgi:hypothetical protein
VQLTRCKDQSKLTLDEFYADEARGEGQPWVAQTAQTMLRLLERLRTLPFHRPVYGLTSHHRLCLLAEDKSFSPWFVIIEPVIVQPLLFVIEYLMPEGTGPWPHARVRGEAHSEDRAVQMILTAMEKSEGWSQSATRSDR